MPSLAIIPARSGSKELPDKNVTTINDIPLIVYTIRAALGSNIFSNVIVSTDSTQYAKIATSYGANVPFIRPVHLSKDNISLDKVTLHTLTTLSKMGLHYDSFAVLQPTCPLRDKEDIKKSKLFFNKKKAEVVISIYKVKHPFYTGGEISNNFSLHKFIDKPFQNTERQKMKNYYHISGAIFLANTQAYLKIQNPFEMNSYGYEISPEHALDIDTAIDLKLAKILLNLKNEQV